MWIPMYGIGRSPNLGIDREYPQLVSERLEASGARDHRHCQEGKGREDKARGRRDAVAQHEAQLGSVAGGLVQANHDSSRDVVLQDGDDQSQVLWPAVAAGVSYPKATRNDLPSIHAANDRAYGRVGRINPGDDPPVGGGRKETPC